MRKWTCALILTALIAVPWPAVAQGMLTLGAGSTKAAAISTYIGPGDVVSGATMFYSCARVYNAASANASTSLCDLVDSAAPAAVICTLRGTIAGTVDLANSYCTGGLTPSAKCAAATGGVCNISKAYNQVNPGTLDVVQTTAANQPTLKFSVLNGLPAMTFAGSQKLVSSGSLGPLGQPWTVSSVFERTGNFTAFSIIMGMNNANATVTDEEGGANSANTCYMYDAHIVPTAACADGTSSADFTHFHAMQNNFNDGGGTSNFYIDGVSTAANLGGGQSINSQVHVGENAASPSTGQLIGYIMETGLWFLDFSVSSRQSNMNSNQHGTKGYNF